MKMTIAQALNATHHELMASDDRVIVIGEDIAGGAGLAGGEGMGGVFGVTSGLVDKFGPSRVIDTPISETAFVGMGIGAAMTGLKPIVEVMFCDFMGVWFDQIFNQAAKVRMLSGGAIKLPLVIRTTMGAGDSSGAMHSQSLHGMLSTIPGLVVVCPSSASDAAGLLKSAVDNPNPVVFMEHKGLYGNAENIPDNTPKVPIGKGNIVSEGGDVTIVAVSKMIHEAQLAAATLRDEGLGVEIVDPRTINPLDEGIILESLEKTGRLLVVDEGFGFADKVVSLVAERAFSVLKAAPKAINPLNTPVPYAPNLEKAWLPNSEVIVKAVKQLMCKGL